MKDEGSLLVETPGPEGRMQARKVALSFRIGGTAGVEVRAGAVERDEEPPVFIGESAGDPSPRFAPHTLTPTPGASPARDDGVRVRPYEDG